MTRDGDPGELPAGTLIASGRAADVFDLGDGTVLRRYRSDHDVEPEGHLMVWLASTGFPVPMPHRADGRDLVMERIDGPTMLEDLQRKPWHLLRHARLLAELQRLLNGVVAPDWLTIVGGNDSGYAVEHDDVVVHGDLHPMNVILSPQGPVVIDFTNAGRGCAAFDAANSFVLMSTFETSGVIGRVGQRMFARAFRRARGAALIDAGLDDACDSRLADRNVTDGERHRVEKLRATPT